MLKDPIQILRNRFGLLGFELSTLRAQSTWKRSFGGSRGQVGSGSKLKTDVVDFGALAIGFGL